MSRYKSRYITREVEVDIGEVDDEVLIEILEERGFSVRGKTVPGDDWTRLADAYHFNRNPEQTLRDLVYENTGRILS